MTEPDTAAELPFHTLVVPNSIDMVALLGPRDEHLTLIEKAFKADLHVRGNQVTMRGESAEVACWSGSSTSWSRSSGPARA